MIRALPALRVGIDLFISRFPLMMGILLITTAIRVAIGLIPDETLLALSTQSILSAIILPPLTAGQYWVALRIVRGEPASIRDFFRSFRRWGALVGISIVTSFVVGIGSLLLVVPGIVWGLGLLFAPIALLDARKPDGTPEKAGVFNALQDSQEIAKGYKGVLFRISLILGLPMAVSVAASLLSLYAPGIPIPNWVLELLPLLSGVVFMGPIGATTFMTVYEQIVRLGQSPREPGEVSANDPVGNTPPASEHSDLAHPNMSDTEAFPTDPQ